MEERLSAYIASISINDFPFPEVMKKLGEEYHTNSLRVPTADLKA